MRAKQRILCVLCALCVRPKTLCEKTFTEIYGQFVAIRVKQRALHHGGQQERCNLQNSV